MLNKKRNKDEENSKILFKVKKPEKIFEIKKEPLRNKLTTGKNNVNEKYFNNSNNNLNLNE